MLSKTYLKYLLIIGCVVSLAACGAKKRASTASMDLPEEFVLPDSLSQSLDTMLISRNEFFKDSILNNLIEDGLQNNFDVRIANKEIEIFDEYFKESKMGFFPRLNLNLFSIERRWFSENSRNSPNSTYYDRKGREPSNKLYLERLDHTSSAALDWELDLWGKIRNQKREARALYRQSKVARRVLETELIATIAQDYYSLLMLDEQVEVAQKNHKFRDSTLAMIQLLYKAGEVTALAVQQSQTQVLEASSLISQLKEQRAIQENNLRLLTGKLPGRIMRSGELESRGDAYAQVRELPLYLVENRPDVLVARHGLIAANARVGVTQAQRYPNLTITAEAGLESLLPQNWFNVPGSLFGSFVGGLTAPVLQGRKLKTDYRVAKLQRDEAEIDFQRSVFEAVTDIQNIMVSLDGLEDQLEIANVKQLVAQQALENSRMLFRSGFADYLEVITAQGEAMETELDLVRTRANLMVERIQLYRALGGGWK